MLLSLISCKENDLVGTWQTTDNYSLTFSKNNVLEIHADTGMFEYNTVYFNYRILGDSINFYRNEFDCMNYWCTYTLKNNSLSIASLHKNDYYKSLFSAEVYTKRDTNYIVNDGLGFFHLKSKTDDILPEKYFGYYVNLERSDTIKIGEQWDDVLVKLNTFPLYKAFAYQNNEWIIYPYCSENLNESINETNFEFAFHFMYRHLNSYYTTIEFIERNDSLFLNLSSSNDNHVTVLNFSKLLE